MEESCQPKANPQQLDAPGLLGFLELMWLEPGCPGLAVGTVISSLASDQEGGSSGRL